MAKLKKRQMKEEKYGKCKICLGNIPVEYYFSKGDEIICYECGTEYTLVSKNPVKLDMTGDYLGPEDYYGELYFEDY